MTLITRITLKPNDPNNPNNFNNPNNPSNPTYLNKPITPFQLDSVLKKYKSRIEMEVINAA
jgi:hypothetical protein